MARAVLLRWTTMHEIFFCVKRAFHGVLRVTRDGLAKLGLTAARFDLLYALQERVPPFFCIWQSQLREMLGVSAPVVSRMLKSLEALGFVTRQRSVVDRRQLDVELTPKGRSRIRLAIARMITSGQAKLMVDLAVAREDAWCNESECLLMTDTLEGLLRGMRERYGDSATLYYPWHPDD